MYSINNDQINTLCINKNYKYTFNTSLTLSSNYIQLKQFFYDYDPNIKVVDMSNVLAKHDFYDKNFIPIFRHFKKSTNIVYYFDYKPFIYQFADVTHNPNLYRYNMPFIMIIKGVVLHLDFKILNSHNFPRFIEYHLSENKQCDICMLNRRNSYICRVCFKPVCHDCFKQFNNMECPFCRTSF